MATIAEQVFEDHVGESVTPGDIFEVPIDLAFGHDVTLPPAIEEFDRLDVDGVFDPDSVVVIPDHLVPAHDDHSAALYQQCEEFADNHDVIFYPQGEQGQEHVVLPEDGHIKPGDIVVGADSHTCTQGALGAYATGIGSTDLAYAMAFGSLWLRVPKTTRVTLVGEPDPWVSGKDLVLATLETLGVDGAVYHALEFGGPAVSSLPMDERFTLANMAVEAGAATGLVEPDETTRAYVEGRTDGVYECYSPEDPDYAREVVIECSDLEPQVAVPSLPANTRPVSSVEADGIRLDQVVIGSCTNGRETDLRAAAAVLEGRSVADGVRLIITPGSQSLARKSIREGWTETFLAAGATVESPGCGACFGMRTGVLGENEVAVSTTNRNFTGRMGHQTSEVYLTSPSVAAASAVAGTIVGPTTVGTGVV